MVIAGIDYSMTCPAICVYNGDGITFSFNQCKFYFLTDRKKYADKYRLLRKIEKQQIEELRAERAQNSRFSTLIHRAASIAEKKLLEVVETEKFLDGAKVMCVFYIKKPDTPIVVLEITDYEKWELEYESTELAKQICKTIRGKI